MKWIKSHPWILVCALGFLLCCKSCQSCSRQRTIEYNQAQYEHQIDSIRADLSRANDSIKILNIELDNLKERYNIVEGTLEHTRTTNQSLIRSNNVLSNKIKK